MVLRQVELYNYRNFISLDLQLEAPRTILIGPNAQGKTNILEALYFSSWGGSFKRIQPEDQINWSSESARVEVKTRDQAGENNLTTIIKRGERTITQLNKNTNLKKREAAGLMAAFYFSPFVEKYIHGEPVYRRRIFDLINSQKYRNFSNLIAKYSKILRNRNYILRRGRFEELKIWDEAFVAAGAEIILRRILLLKDLNGYLETVLGELLEAEDNYSVQVVYVSSILSREEQGKLSESSLASVRGMFQKVLNNSLEKEKKFRQSLVGPHRDEFWFLKNGRDLRFYSSRGEGLKIISALKIAQFDLLGQNIASPVFLVDDLLQELDKEKGRLLMASLGRRGQVVVATAHEESLTEEVMSGKKYLIKNGTARPW